MSAASPTTSPALICGGDLSSTIDQVSGAALDPNDGKQAVINIDSAKPLFIGPSDPSLSQLSINPARTP